MTFLAPGISGKSQVLFAMVFITRYLDLATNYVSVYNSVMKVIFIVSSIATCYLIFFKFRATYDSNHDAFRAEFLVIPTAGLALLVNHEFSVMEVCPCFCLALSLSLSNPYFLFPFISLPLLH